MMMFQLQPDDTFQSAINRILQSTDYNEPITRYLVQVMQTFGVGPTAPPGEPISSERANPVEVSFPSVSFPDANWYTIVPATTITLPQRPGNSLLQVAARLKLTWTANSNTNGLCDWSIDGGTHFWRTLHVVVNRTDDSSVNDAFVTFWAVVSGTSPSVSIIGRQYTGGQLITVIGAGDPLWPNLASTAVIFDQGPIT